MQPGPVRYRCVIRYRTSPGRRALATTALRGLAGALAYGLLRGTLAGHLPCTTLASSLLRCCLTGGLLRGALACTLLRRALPGRLPCSLSGGTLPRCLLRRSLAC